MGNPAQWKATGNRMSTALPQETNLPQETGPAQAYLAYCRALRDDDLPRMQAAVVPEQAARMESEEFQKQLPLVRMFLPEEIEVLSVEQEGDEARLTMKGKFPNDGQPGWALMVLLDGAWKVAGERWSAA